MADRFTAADTEVASSTSRNPARYISALERLLLAVQELALARDVTEVQRIVTRTARGLTGCDGASFVLLDGDQCQCVEEDASEPVWKGQSFPVSDCMSGWAMLNAQSVVIPDIYVDDRVPQAAYRATFVRSLAIVPIGRQSPVSAIGTFWGRTHGADPDDLQLLQNLADSAAIAVENIRIYDELDRRARARTLELQRANAEIRQLSMTDELTGLRNRRGFYLLAEQALLEARRQRAECLVMYLDVDGLKHVNDRYGHAAGDALLASVAQVLRATVRESDVVARTGGDEFCVLSVEPGADGERLRERLRRNLHVTSQGHELPYPLSASIGFASTRVDSDTQLERLVSEADAAMYADKRTRRGARAA